jgi:uncharacterized damage-inducible protein DinB
MEILFVQYELIRERREALFEYCESLEADHFAQDIPAFGDRSIRSQLVHVSNTYKFWLGHFAEIDKAPFAKSGNYPTVRDVRFLFDETNSMMTSFLTKVQPGLGEPFVNKVPMFEFELSLSPLQLFNQVVTHEDHHNAQVVSMSRQLGYAPAHTDFMTPR